MQKGSKHTEETKRKISEGRKGQGIGNTYGTANKGRPGNCARRGKRHTEATKAKMSAAHRARLAAVKEEQP